MSRANTIIFSFLLVATLLWIAHYYMERGLELKGISLQALQEQAKALHDENNQLQNEVYRNESLTTIADKARALGFITETNSIMYVK